VDNKTVFYIRGAATVLSLPKLATALERVPASAELHIHLEEMDYIDHACLDLLMNWEVQHKSQGGMLVIDWGTLGVMLRERRRDVRKAHKTSHQSAETDGDSEYARPRELLSDDPIAKS